MKIACYAGAALFALFTAVQFNDLDQYGTSFFHGWIILYATTAVISLLLALGKPLHWILGALAVALFVAAACRFTFIEWDKTVLFNETNPAGNESGGLFIIALWTAFLAWKKR